ncbi:hypothetical protein VTK73DRAFT_4509 [Phialemonium thermophilum]|uniref:Uncharacterized protein n=1 Tax=Phialemonium thermophilum TaxID=223376 RepID=A0ABR3V876_9PEZI
MEDDGLVRHDAVSRWPGPMLQKGKARGLETRGSEPTLAASWWPEDPDLVKWREPRPSRPSTTGRRWPRRRAWLLGSLPQVGSPVESVGLVSAYSYGPWMRCGGPASCPGPTGEKSEGNAIRRKGGRVSCHIWLSTDGCQSSFELDRKWATGRPAEATAVDRDPARKR